tara:strand:- start:29654 stop:31453 length:1800 start_codon:yes stop_codon:yes gene_type:complete
MRPSEPVKPTEPVKSTEPSKPPVTPTPSTPVTPTPPPKKQLDRNRLDVIVRRATNDYIRDVLDIVGEAYQVRYNVREGMLRAINRIGNYELESVVQNSSEYQNGVSSGRINGKNEGASAGRSSANYQSNQVAQSDINAAINHTLDTGAAIKFTQTPRKVLFNGASSNVTAPRSIESRWSDNESYKISQIRRLLRRDVPSQFTNGLFSLSSIYNNHATRKPSDLDSPYAFSTWYDNDLRTSSGAATEARNFYKEITNASLFEQASENGALFKSDFNRNVDNGTNGALDRQWNRKVTSLHLGAMNLGETLYLQEAASYAADLGYYHGYNDVFNDASVVAFNESYLPFYKSNFAAIEKQVRNNPNISEIQAEIVSEEGKSEVTYGDTFNVVIKNIANRGMVADDVAIEIPAQNQITSFNNKPTVRVNGLTRIKQPQVTQRLAWISSITKPDQNIAISARVHHSTISVTVKATYEELIRKAVRAQTADLSLWTMNLALGFMKTQYDELSGFRDQYYKRDPSMLLVRMRKLYDSMTDAEKAQLRVHGQLIRNVFGGKPVRFLNPKRDEWDSTQNMIKEMELPGVEPKEVNGANNNQGDIFNSNN